MVKFHIRIQWDNPCLILKTAWMVANPKLKLLLKCWQKYSLESILKVETIEDLSFSFHKSSQYSTILNTDQKFFFSKSLTIMTNDKFLVYFLCQKISWILLIFFWTYKKTIDNFLLQYDFWGTFLLKLCPIFVSMTSGEKFEKNKVNYWSEVKFVCTYVLNTYLFWFFYTYIFFHLIKKKSFWPKKLVLK